MSVRSFQQLMLPALQTIGQRYDEISIAGLEDELVKTLRISPEERNIMLPSGNQRLISNRLNWASPTSRRRGSSNCRDVAIVAQPIAAGSCSPRE